MEQTAEKEKKKVYRSVILMASFLTAVAVIALGTATYAWFTFSPETNIVPMSSTISSGETALYISTMPDSGFSVQCALPAYMGGDLEPISTADLNQFYQSVMQDRNGISTACKDTTETLTQKAITGTIYLKSLKDNCSIYFYRPNMSIPTDSQTLASLRLGIRFTTTDGTKQYIFALNHMGDTSKAEELLTVPNAGTVVAGVNTDGSVSYIPDPAVEITAYTAALNTEGKPSHGQIPLCVIGMDEVVRADYWLYLEGCDVNCFNAVCDKDCGLQLSFAGVTEE